MIYFRSIALRWAYPCVCRADPCRWSRRQYGIDLSPWIRGGFALWCEECRSDRLIPVRTERIRQYLLQNHPGMVHPRIHGADLIRQWVKCRNQGFIPVHTGQILNSPRKFLRLRSVYFHLKIPWQNQYVSSFWNVFCGWHFLVIFFTIFAKKEMQVAPLSRFVSLSWHSFLLALFQGFALDQCVVFSRAVIRFGMFAVVK